MKKRVFSPGKQTLLDMLRPAPTHSASSASGVMVTESVWLNFIT